MKILDRVKLIEPHKLHNGIIIPINTVGTVRDIKEHDISIQLGIDLTKQKKVKGDNCISIFVTVTDLIVTDINESELQRIDFRYITSKIFHPGNMWSVKVDYDDNGDPIYKSGIIEDYHLALSEDNDEITLTFLEDIYNYQKFGTELYTNTYKKRYLDQFGSYSVIFE